MIIMILAVVLAILTIMVVDGVILTTDVDEVYPTVPVKEVDEAIETLLRQEAEWYAQQQDEYTTHGTLVCIHCGGDTGSTTWVVCANTMCMADDALYAAQADAQLDGWYTTTMVDETTTITPLLDMGDDDTDDVWEYLYPTTTAHRHFRPTTITVEEEYTWYDGMSVVFERTIPTHVPSTRRRSNATAPNCGRKARTTK